MKVVILCGGYGTRLSEETVLKPKPLVTVGSQPILCHIMNIYSAFNFNEFTLALGYKGEEIKSYFLNYYTLNADFKVDMSTGGIEYLSKPQMNWSVEMVDTGQGTLTGGRLHRLEDKVGGQSFMLTYGDGVANVDIKRLVEFHKSHGKIATVTAVRPNARFGTLAFDESGVISSFREKKQTDSGWINGGFFVFEPEVFKYLDGDQTVLEAAPMEALAKDGQLVAYQHHGFWQCMDTLRDRNYLEELWSSGKAPWVLDQNLV